MCCAGHGNTDRLCGYTEHGYSPYTPILKSNEVESEIVNERIFHFLACKNGVIGGLGEKLVEKGCRAFIGYDKEVVGNTGRHENQFKPDCLIAESLLKGHSVGESVTKGEQSYKRFGNGFSTLPNVINNIMQNMKSLCFYGDEDARLYDQHTPIISDFRDADRNDQIGSIDRYVPPIIDNAIVAVPILSFVWMLWVQIR